MRILRSLSLLLLLLASYHVSIYSQAGCPDTPLVLDITADNPNPQVGEPICYSLIATGFTNVSAIGFSIKYSPNTLLFDSYNGNLSGIPSFNDAVLHLEDNNELRVFWFTSNGSSVSIMDGSTLIEMCFIVNGLPGEELVFDLSGPGISTLYPEVDYTDETGFPCPGLEDGTLSSELDNLPEPDIPSRIACDCTQGAQFEVLGMCGASGGQANGSLEISVCCVAEPYTVFIGNSRINNLTGDTYRAENLAAGTYIISVVDANNEQAPPIPFDIGTATPIAFDLTSRPTACITQNTGAIDLENFSGGTPYSDGTYLVRSNISAPEFSNELTLRSLPNGTFDLSIVDSLGCSVDTMVTLFTDSVRVSSSFRNSTCFGIDNGEITLTASGGTPFGVDEYRYYIQGYSAYDSTPVNRVGISQVYSINGLPAGTYAVFSEDSGLSTPRCRSEIDTIRIENINMYDITVTPAGGSCNTGEREVEIAIDAQPNTLLTPFFYTIFDTDNNPMVSNLMSSDLTFTTPCLPFGEYRLEVLDDSQPCAFREEFVVDGCNITYNRFPTIGFSCPGENSGSITGINAMSADGTVTYEWQDGSTDQNRIDLAPGQYTVTLSDGLCTVVDSFIVEQGDAPMVTLTPSASNLCGSGQLDLVITVPGTTGPYEYLWLLDPDDPTSEVRYEISDIPTDTLYNADYSTLYSIEVFDGVSTCPGLEMINVAPSSNPRPNVDITNLVNTRCLGDSSGSAVAVVTPDVLYPGPFDFLSSTGETAMGQISFQMNDLPAGENYVLIFTDQGCQIDSFNFDIGEGEALRLDQAATSISPQILCFGDMTNVNLAVQGNFNVVNYAWEDGTDGPFNIVGVGTQVINLSSNGCTGVDSIVITGPDSLVAVLDAPQSNIGLCDSDLSDLLASVSGGTMPYQYEWLDESGTRVSTDINADGVPAGDYTLQVTDVNGCTDDDAFSITTALPVEVFVGMPIDPLCFGEQGQVYIDSVRGGTGPYRYQVDSNAPVDITDTVSVVSGERIISVFDLNGCSANTTVMIETPDEVSISIQGDTEVLLSQSSTLTTSVVTTPNVDTIIWMASDNSDIPCGTSDCTEVTVTPLNTTVYTATLVNTDNCMASDEITVSVVRTENIIAPNVFSPLAPNPENRIFSVSLGAAVESIEYLRIFDRWGNLIHEEINPPFNANGTAGNWNGSKLNNETDPQAAGVYVYVMQVRFLGNPDPEIRKGDVTLIR